MKPRLVYLLLTAAVSSVLFAGCASYKKPFEATTKNSYTTLKPEEKTLLPNNIRTLTLEQAQNIALNNNPTFKTKYFAIAAARARYYQSFSSYYPTVGIGM